MERCDLDHGEVDFTNFRGEEPGSNLDDDAPDGRLYDPPSSGRKSNHPGRPFRTPTRLFSPPSLSVSPQPGPSRAQKHIVNPESSRPLVTRSSRRSPSPINSDLSDAPALDDREPARRDMVGQHIALRQSSPPRRSLAAGPSNVNSYIAERNQPAPPGEQVLGNRNSYSIPPSRPRASSSGSDMNLDLSSHDGERALRDLRDQLFGSPPAAPININIEHSNRLTADGAPTERARPAETPLRRARSNSTEPRDLSHPDFPMPHQGPSSSPPEPPRFAQRPRVRFGLSAAEAPSAARLSHVGQNPVHVGGEGVGGSRNDVGGTQGNPINLAEDDDDDPVWVGGVVRMPAPPVAPRLRQEGLGDAATRLRDRELRARAILDADRDESRRSIMSPPPAPDPPRIGFGGAVLRRGDRQVHFSNNRQAAVENPPVPPPVFSDGSLPPHNGGYAALLERLGNLRNGHGTEDRDAVRDAYDQFREAGLAQIYRRLGRGEALAMGLMADPALEGVHRHHRIPNIAYDGVLDRFGMRGMLAGMDVEGILDRAGGAGRGVHDIPNLLAKVEVPLIPPPTYGFTSDFELDQNTVPQSPIMIDDDGRVVPKRNKRKPKSYLACAKCPEPLLISSAYRIPADRVWALRCGHLVDQRCLDALSRPTTADERANVKNGMPGGLEVLDSDTTYTGGGRAKRRRPPPRKTAPVKPAEYTWCCPVKGCRRTHVSVHSEKGWVQKEWAGAMQVYV